MICELWERGKKRKWIKSSALVFDKNWLVLWNCLASFHIKNVCIFLLLKSCRLYAIDHWWPKLILDMFQTFPQLYWLFFFFFFLFFFFSFWESPTLLTFFFFFRIPYVIDLFLINNWSLVRLKSVNSTKVLFGNQVPYKPDSH